MATVTKPCPGDPATLPTTITEVQFTPTMAMTRPGDPVTPYTTRTVLKHYINPPGMESQKMAGVKISFFKLKSDINTLV